MKGTKNYLTSIRDTCILLFIFFVALWLSPFILIIFAIFLIKKIYYYYSAKKVLKDIHSEWFPKKTYIFFLYSNSAIWKTYFETELIPRIEKKAIIKNWSTRHTDGWWHNRKSIEYRIVRFLCSSRYIYPCGIIFFPSGTYEICYFHDAYIAMIKSHKPEYKHMEARFLELTNTL